MMIRADVPALPFLDLRDGLFETAMIPHTLTFWERGVSAST